MIIYRIYAVLLGLTGLFGVAVRYWRPGVKTPGWDFMVYCDAATAFVQGTNPYIVENLAQSTLSFVYPPTTLPLFAGLCFPTAIVPPIVVHTVLYALFLLGSGALIYSVDPSPDVFLLATFLVVSFGGTYRAFETGNFSIFLTFLLAIVFAGLIREREWIVGLALTTMAAFKLFPIFFAGPLLVSDRSRREKIRTVGVIAGTIATFVVVNILAFPTYVETYYLSITGQLPQHSPVNAGGGRINPSLYFLTDELNNNIGGVPLMQWVLYLGVVALVAGLFYYYVRYCDNDTVRTLSLGIIAVLLILPRLKPYTLVLAALPAYFLVKDTSLRAKTMFLTIAAAIPIAAIPFQVMIGDRLWFYQRLLQARTMIDFAPTIVLLAFFISVVLMRMDQTQIRERLNAALN